MKYPSRKLAILAFAFIVATSFVFSGTTLLDLQASAKPFAVFSHAIRNALPTISPNPVAATATASTAAPVSSNAGVQAGFRVTF